MAMQTAAEAEAVVLPLMADEMMPEKTKDHVIRRLSKMSGVLSKGEITMIPLVYLMNRKQLPSSSRVAP